MRQPDGKGEADDGSTEAFRLEERLLELIPGGTIEDGAVRMTVPFSAVVSARCASDCGSPETTSTVTIRPEVSEIRDNGMAILHFLIGSPEWDREIFEVQVGVGDTPEESVGNALSLFAMAMLNHGLRCMGCAARPSGSIIRERTEFAGRPHDWSIWLGNIVSRGSAQPHRGLVAHPVSHTLHRAARAHRLHHQRRAFGRVLGKQRLDRAVPHRAVDWLLVGRLSFRAQAYATLAGR